ncbi:MAG: hypothetical protein VB124_04050, partial [Burkholderia sp.]
TPSYALVAEPQTNGVAERFNRTMKEQAIHGRLFNNVEKFVLPPSRSRTDTITNSVSKNWASSPPPRSPSGSALATCHLMAKSCLNNRIRYTRPPLAAPQKTHP